MDSILIASVQTGPGRDWLETAYLFSSIVLAIVGIIALWQLVLTKHDIQVRSRREAVVLAAELCRNFAREVIPKAGKCFDTLAADNVTAKCWPVKDSKFCEASFEDWKAAEAWFQRVERSTGHLRMMTEVCNDLEAFAIYFMKGAADEKVAFGAVGVLYCDWTSKLAPYLVVARSPKTRPPAFTSGPFQNAVDLHAMWVSRLTRSELDDASKEIDARMQKLEDKSIDPIGT